MGRSYTQSIGLHKNMEKKSENTTNEIELTQNTIIVYWKKKLWNENGQCIYFIEINLIRNLINY